jgi:hypothetical protein
MEALVARCPPPFRMDPEELQMELDFRGNQYWRQYRQHLERDEMALLVEEARAKADADMESIFIASLQKELDLRSIDVSGQHLEREELVRLVVEARAEKEKELEQKWRKLRNDNRERDQAAAAADTQPKGLCGKCCGNVHFFGAPNHEIDPRHRKFASNLPLLVFLGLCLTYFLRLQACQ